MIASLAMYDRPETAAATDRFWALIRDGLRQGGIAAPDHLERDAPFWPVWQAHDLVFSQTCGRPFRQVLHAQVQLVGTPDYGLKDCPPGHYRSAFISRARDPRTDLAAFRDATFAFNEVSSQSGWAAPQVHAAGLGFTFTDCLETGGHVASARAVADGRADIAALDAMTWELVKRYEDCAGDLRVLGWTTPTPGLPYITGAGMDVGKVASTVAAAIAALDLADRRMLRIVGLVAIPAAEYLAIADP
ncbi:MAG: PhnD/SsuA/transferrin family substrate-binding protein [Rhodobacteraceae bacterium]|nr:PhnD/SsuA/transferrin family substrate-binding protein [Paracoccaceae bacterium]